MGRQYKLGTFGQYGCKRRFACRGPKQRYSVFKAEMNARWELINKLMCENICEANNLDLRYHMVEHKRSPWHETYRKLRADGYYGSRSIRDQQAEITRQFGDQKS